MGGGLAYPLRHGADSVSRGPEDEYLRGIVDMGR